MFGAICSGQPVQLATEVDNLKYTIEFKELPSSISFITIFMLPNIQFDLNYTALIYFKAGPDPEFKLLGGLGIEKQSAIYRINQKPVNRNDGLSSSSNNNMVDDIDMDTDNTGATQEVIIGISIETNQAAEFILQQSKLNNNNNNAVNKTKLLTSYANNSVNANSNTILQNQQLANKIIENCYNYLSSFDDGTGKVPIAKFNEWWKKFMIKLKNNPKLLSSSDSDLL
ncbi:hypothetical protein PACTADRAFT_48130 [Pachysolen tannophilus NRRL Y-2460]|uniref:Uncharacterized protein n=1 Tax=Pachysolen tannophilus NRRL Y-2460 TaxID=669874 RepID=A0A1E4U2Y4_PACTA|nr:hypothetical protein PACTADRAFT_48130 [Pachysolen tannophilus NRRL Y-2460]